ncbi:MAG: glycoside hydrolase family 97 protein [marine benthic group bacterium]|nr:glycoside hydrolase family 97 protein [Gemmatimonadota bacterium]
MKPITLPAVTLLSATLLIPRVAGAQEPIDYSVVSPDGRIELSVQAGDELTYRVSLDGEALVSASPIALHLADGNAVGPGMTVAAARRENTDAWLEPVVPEKRSRIRDHYSALHLDFDGGWGLDARAYDDGVAFRFRATERIPIVIASEDFTVNLVQDPDLWFPVEESFLTHSERLYERLRVSQVEPETMAHLPILASWSGGPKLAITESDLQAYPGLYLAGTGTSTLVGLSPAYPADVEQVNDRTVRVVSREPYIARTSGPRTFPWRVFVVADEDADLVSTTMVWRLAAPLRIEDASWIRPGQVAWDWWNALNLTGVDFEAGVNTDTYRYFVDFAADQGIEYVILDEGWSDPADLTVLNPEVDLDVLFAHAADRGVGLIPWVVWKSLDDRLDESLDRFEAWGAVGIKVDFMQRDDQPMVEYYWRIAEAAARRHLLVDFHGAYKPAGLRRAYPNVVTREGVRGLEHVKWSPYPTPEHDVTLPFIRMLAGPMDYTPGAMLNATEEQFKPVFDRPMSLGTRVHQMAMYVVYESPLQMLADSPSHYLQEAECTAFIVDVPTVWDDTRVLAASVSDYLAVARRSGDSWYIGAMTDWESRHLSLDTGFLEEGAWSAEVFEDGQNAGRNPQDYRQVVLEFEAGEPLEIQMAPGGGWVAKLVRRTEQDR